MDLTPFVGIIGAIVGGCLGLLGQRMNLGEQRRKDRRERVASFLDAADAMDRAVRNLAEAWAVEDQASITKALDKISDLYPKVGHHGQYLELILSKNAHATILAAAIALGEAFDRTSMGPAQTGGDTSKVEAKLEEYAQKRATIIAQAKQSPSFKERMANGKEWIANESRAFGS